MDSMLKFGKLGLTEDGSTEAIQEVIQNSKTSCIVFYFF